MQHVQNMICKPKSLPAGHGLHTTLPDQEIMKKQRAEYLVNEGFTTLQT